MKRETWKLVLRINCHRLASAAKAMNAAISLAALRSGVVAASISSPSEPIRSSVRHASPNSKRWRRPLEPMFFHAPVKGAAAEPQLRRGKGDVEMVHSERPLNHLPFQLVEVE